MRKEKDGNLKWSLPGAGGDTGKGLTVRMYIVMVNMVIMKVVKMIMIISIIIVITCVEPHRGLETSWVIVIMIIMMLTIIMIMMVN